MAEPVGKGIAMKLEQRFRQIDRKLDGRMGICVEDLETEKRWGLREDELFPTASLIKVQILAVLCERAKRGKADLSRKLRVPKRDIVGGSGVLKNLTPGGQYSLRDLAVLMIILSDNTATNVLIDYLGVQRINDQLRAWGYEQTTLHRKINFDLDTKDPKWLAESTPGETADLLSRIARRKLLGARYDRLVEEILAQQKYDTAIPRLLPGSGTWDEKNPDFIVAHKTGSIEHCRIDGGIVTSPAGRYVIAVFTKDLDDNRYHPDNEGVLAIAKASRAAYDHIKKKHKT